MFGGVCRGVKWDRAFEHWGQIIFTEPGIGPGDTRMQHGDKLRRGICGACLLNCGDIIIGALETVPPPGGRFCVMCACVRKNGVQWETRTSVSRCLAMPRRELKIDELPTRNLLQQVEYQNTRVEGGRYNIWLTWQFLLLLYGCFLNSNCSF